VLRKAREVIFGTEADKSHFKDENHAYIPIRIASMFQRFDRGAKEKA
jgi:hypothetical protein